MILVGLTGGVGMGKTRAARFIQQRGIPVIDTDVLAREVVEPGQPAWEQIRRDFGEEIIGPDGQLRRDELARQVFADESRRKHLESITHPRIRERWLAQAEDWQREGQPLGVVVIPLLFETDTAGAFSAIVCVACSAATQRERLLARGWKLEQAQQRIQAQWPIEKKIALANYVVWTEGALEVHELQIERILLAVRALQKLNT
jgi:dephospho-CoA kinase